MRLLALPLRSGALVAAVLAAACGAAPRSTDHDVTDASQAPSLGLEPDAPALPELDLAAPDDFATATFALG